MDMIIKSCYFKRITSLVVLVLLSIQLTFAQRLEGKWQCTKESLLEMGLGYTGIKGKCTFKKNGTFTLVIKGRSLLGHSNFPFRTMSAKVTGKYAVDGNSITSAIDAKDVKVYVQPEKDDPDLDPETEAKRKFTTWDAPSRWYETLLFECEVQEQTIREKILELWTWNGLPVSYADKNNVSIGNLIKLSK